ncbi:hypothetical protein [Microbulbifer epialgicus]|uniref:Spore coat protein U (SCPU) domain-containing protein n=1 Tax=Microbulbifer epialgicus TaxID=393907 RepID=A0ABV4P3Z6_9GAMM
MKKNVVRSLISAVTAGLLFSTSLASMAVEDSANSIITLSITPTIEISGVKDIPLTISNLSDPVEGDSTFCVAGFGFSTFSIRFDSDDDPENGTAFVLTGNGVNVPYSVEFVNDTSESYQPVTSGTPINNLDRQADSCGSDNARFQVTVNQNDWQNEDVLNGTIYTDTLLITVASE